MTAPTGDRLRDDVQADDEDVTPSPDALEIAPRARWRPKVPVEVVVLAVAATLTRLVGIGHPNAIVFDELYFREFALRYLTGSYYFDLHPPVGKLLLGGWAALFGLSADPAGTDPVTVLRVLPALAGIGLVLVFYQFLRELRTGRKVATLGAALVLLDNAILVESRLTLINGMLLLFGMGALTCYLASRRSTGRAHWVLFGSAAVLAGLAVGTKWTGAAALGLIGLVWFAGTVRHRVPLRSALPQAAVLLIVPAIVYVAAFAVHFTALPNTGPGDAYMSQRFQSTLVGNPNYDPAVAESLPEQIAELNAVIPGYEAGLNDSTHPYSSEWYSWPLMLRGVYYWTNGAPSGTPGQYIYLLGNPVLWWGLIVAAVALVLVWLRRPEIFARRTTTFALLGVAWVANFLPFSLIERPMFLYHYFFALLFALAAVVLGLGLTFGWTTDGERPWAFPSRFSAGVYWGILAVALVGFLWFVPLTYGLPLDQGGLNARMWLSSWR